jgi:2-keto-4-pentenoate hydratase/2-oxohepta-3-ene-1,7-dioic acid hydratase in catechol pathway
MLDQIAKLGRGQMRLTSFSRSGRPSYGIVTEDCVRDIGGTLGDRLPTLRAALAAGIDLAAAEGDVVSLDEITLLPVIPDPEKILCVGINYATHIAETGRDTPKFPMLFPRYADTLIAHGAPMLLPHESDTFDYEGELAVIIGTAGRRIDVGNALDHVAGYTCFNDGTIREWQRHTSQFMPGKNFPGTGGLGPWMVTTAAIPDPAVMTLQTRLNGEVMQEAAISDLVFGVAELVAYCSTFTTLNPGDIIATGTPGGVGAFRDPKVWMKPGDTIEVEIGGIGVLSNPVVVEG